MHHQEDSTDCNATVRKIENRREKRYLDIIDDISQKDAVNQISDPTANDQNGGSNRAGTVLFIKE